MEFEKAEADVESAIKPYGLTHAFAMPVVGAVLIAKAIILAAQIIARSIKEK